MKSGALPSQTIRSLIQSGIITGGNEERIQPASLDLALTETVYRIEYIFQPRPNESIEDILNEMDATPHNLTNPFERGVMYLAKLSESLKLPKDISARCNPKSSTGRNDLQVRVLADGVPRFDTIPAGFTGNLWIVIMSKSFPVKLPTDESLSQMRFFYADATSRISEDELRTSLEQDKLFWRHSGEKPFTNDEIKIRDNDGSLILTVDIINEGITAWECLGLNRILDFTKRNYYKPTDFFRPISIDSGSIYLKQDNFYILRSRERVRIPPNLSSEMIPMDERSGEFRSHYSGFIDPGWGYGINGDGNGRPLVLEVRPFEDLVLRDNQPIAKIVFDTMHEKPDITYDALEHSHYTEEPKNPKLSKHFITS